MTHHNRAMVRGILLDCVPGKCLRLKRGGRIWKYYDISKFYKGGGSGRLVDVYRKVFGEEYAKRMDASKGFDVVDDEVVRYCIEDAKACARLAENFVIPANRIVPMKSFYSGATLAKRLRQHHLKKPYQFRPSRLQQFAMNAYGGARIECFQRGAWGFKDNEKLYVYDIRSAYPSVQCDLLEVSGRDTSKVARYIPDAVHSFFRISVDIEEAIMGPLKYKFGGVVFYPVGHNTEVWVDKNELELLMEYDVRFEISKAAHDLSRTEERPYAYLREMYDLRRKAKTSQDPSERQLEFPYKLALNSSYGMLIERTAKYRLRRNFEAKEAEDPDARLIVEGDDVFLLEPHWTAGQFFNPVHACEVTSAIRCKLYRDAYPYQRNLVKFATDSLTFDRRVRLDFGEGLGQYEDSPAYDRAIVVGCGVYGMRSGDKRVNKFRGFDSTDVISLAESNMDGRIIEVIGHGPVRLKEASRERYRWFNTFQERRKGLDINFDRRRDWSPRSLQSFRQLLEGRYGSYPLRFRDITPVCR